MIKIYLPLEAAAQLNSDAVRARFGREDVCIDVCGLPGPPHNRRFAVRLGGQVEPNACSWVLKPPDTLLVKLRKADEGKQWETLDDSAARRRREREERSKSNEGKSTAELLRDMYAEADDEDRAKLAHAWEVGRAKREEDARLR